MLEGRLNLILSKIRWALKYPTLTLESFMRRFVQYLALALFSNKAVQSATSSRVGRAIFDTGYWYYKDWVEIPGSNSLRHYVPADTWAIDVGANIGYFTTKFAKWVSGDGKVIALEPESENFRQLVGRLERSGLMPMVEMVPAACGAHNGMVALNVTPEHPGNHSIADEGDIDVRCVTIDALLIDFRTWSGTAVPALSRDNPGLPAVRGCGA